MSTVCQILKLGAAAPAAASPLPPPNSVGAPTVIDHRSAAKAPPVGATGSAADRSLHAAQPLTPAAGGGNQMYQGELLPAAEIAAREEQARLQAEEAAKNAPKPEAAVKPERKGTDLSTSLLKSWENRISKLAALDAALQDASNTAQQAGKDLAGAAAGAFKADPTKPVSPTMGTYNPFQAGSTAAGIYAGGKKMLFGQLLNKRPHGPLGDLSSPFNRSKPWNQAFARHSAEIPAGGGQLNPLLALGGNFLGSMLGGNLDANKMQEYGQSLTDPSVLTR